MTGTPKDDRSAGRRRAMDMAQAGRQTPRFVERSLSLGKIWWDSCVDDWVAAKKRKMCCSAFLFVHWNARQTCVMFALCGRGWAAYWQARLSTTSDARSESGEG